MDSQLNLLIICPGSDGQDKWLADGGLDKWLAGGSRQLISYPNLLTICPGSGVPDGGLDKWLADGGLGKWLFSRIY